MGRIGLQRVKVARQLHVKIPVIGVGIGCNRLRFTEHLQQACACQSRLDMLRHDVATTLCRAAGKFTYTTLCTHRWNILTFLAALFVLVPVGGLAFAFWSYGDLWG